MIKRPFHQPLPVPKLEIQSKSLFSSIVAWWKKGNRSPEERIAEALANLKEYSIPVANMITYMLIDNPNLFRVGALKGDVLATTFVSTEELPVITVDVMKVIQKRDFLEAVLGHEIFHVNDALVTFGIHKFLLLVGEERNVGWERRTVEKSAIKQENELRRRLLECNPKMFKGMARTRQEQNSRSRAIPGPAPEILSDNFGIRTTIED